MRYQQNFRKALDHSQEMKAERRDDLMRVAGAMGVPREHLANPGRFQEVNRPSLYYDPAARVVEMCRDVARTVAREGDEAKKQSVRRAITLLFSKTLLSQALEPLGQEDYSGKVLTMYQDSVKEISEAECAVAQALQAPAPHTDEAAARELDEAAVTIETTAVSFRDRARKAVAQAFDGHMREWR